MCHSLRSRGLVRIVRSLRITVTLGAVLCTEVSLLLTLATCPVS